jgi:hypothetical protein
MEWIGTLIAAILKAGLPLYIAVFIASALLLFLPQHVISHLGLDQFLASYRMYVGVGLVASASLLAANTLSFIASFVVEPLETWSLNRRGLKTLEELTSAEKDFLCGYIVTGDNTRYASISDGIAQGLVAKNLIYRASNLSTGEMLFPFNLQPYARRLLREHPHLLD